MKINSRDRNAEIEIIRNDSEDPYSAFTIRVRVETDSGIFQGANHLIQFSLEKKFLADFEQFLIAPKGSVRLQMVEDSWLEFYTDSLKDVGVRYRVQRAFEDVSIEGSFILDSEFLNEVKREFSGLLAV